MIPGVILAAGASSRLGRPKALLPTGVAGETFLTRIVATLRRGGVDDVVVVTGPETDAVVELVSALPLPPRLVGNPEPQRGQLSSLRCGLGAVDRPGVRAMLVTLVDLPLVTADTVRLLLDTYRRTAAPVVRPVHQGRHGHPVIFDRSVFDALRHADPAVGAQAVVRAYGGEVLDVPVEDAGAVQDIDTREDYERIVGQPLS